VYLDLDESFWEEAASHFDQEPQKVERDFSLALRTTLDFSPGASVFALHRERYVSWRRSGAQQSPPPFIALLGAFSLAASRMARDESTHASNYYDRLLEVFSIGEAQEVRDILEKSYRQDSEIFWDALGSWLNTNSGKYGWPTAESRGTKKFVSRAMSQAIMRSADKQLLRNVFSELHFQSGRHINIDALKFRLLSHLDIYHPTSNLLRLLRGEDFQELVMRIAQDELLNWTPDAKITKGDTRNSSLYFEVQFYQELGKSCFEMYLVSNSNISLSNMRFNAPNANSSSGFRSFNEGIYFTELHDLGCWSVEPWDKFFPGDLLGEDIELKSAEPESPIFRRSGKSLYVFCRGRAPGQFIETSNPTMGESVLIMCRVERKSDLLAYLDAAAAPGYVALDELTGLPRQWVLFQKVIILRHHFLPDMPELAVHDSEHVSLTGGMQVEANRFHFCHLPTLCVFGWPGEFSVQIMIKLPLAQTEDVVCVESGLKGEYVLELKERLKPGSSCSVEVTVSSTGRSSAAERRIVKFDVVVPGCPTDFLFLFPFDRTILQFSPSIPERFRPASYESLYGQNMDEDLEYVEGCFISVSRGHPSPRTSLRSQPEESSLLGHEFSPNSSRHASDETLSVCNSRQCADPLNPYGVHSFELPYMRGQRVEKYKGSIAATCTFCKIRGQVEVGREKRRVKDRVQAPFSSVRLTSFFNTPKVISKHEIFDSVNSLKFGSLQGIQRIVEHVDTSPWAASEYLLNMSAMGNAEILWDDLKITPRRWSTTKTHLSITSSGLVRLCGLQTSGKQELFMNFCADHSISAERVDGNDIPYVQAHCATEEIDTVIDGVSELFKSSGIEVCHDFAEQLLMLLPPMSAAIEGASQCSIGHLKLEYFEIEGFRWVLTQDCFKVGCYRSREFGSRYFFKGPGMVHDSAVLLERRAALYMAFAARRVLPFRYEKAKRILRVPRHISFPLLVKRCLIAASKQYLHLDAYWETYLELDHEHLKTAVDILYS